MPVIEKYGQEWYSFVAVNLQLLANGASESDAKKLRDGAEAITALSEALQAAGQVIRSLQ